MRSHGPIKPSSGSKSKVSRSAISKVSGPNADKSETSASTELSADANKLAALRPGAITEAEKREGSSKNNNDKGNVAKSDSNDARTFTSSREDGNRDFVSRIWGSNGALKGAGGINGGSSGSGSFSPGASGSYSSLGNISAGIIGSSGSSSLGPVASSSAIASNSSGANSNNTYNSRRFIDDNGNSHRIIDPGNNLTDDQIRDNPGQFTNQGDHAQDPYKQVFNREPDQKPTGTNAALQDYKSLMEGPDKELYQQLEKLVKTYDNNSVGFGTNLDKASKANELTGDNKLRTQALASLVDSLKDDPNKQQYLDNLEKWGGMDIFLSDTLSYGLNKSVGGFVASAEGIRPQMALPKDLTNYTHADIARHEMYHLKDVLADGKLDGMQAGEGQEMQDTLIAAMRGFNTGKYDADKIQKLDIGNLRYGAGYLETLSDNNSQNDLFAYTEANSVLRQEWADKPEEFRAVGSEFEKLADMFEKSESTYEDSYVKKDGTEDGTNMT